MNKQKIWLAWTRLFLVSLAMAMLTLACEVPTDGKFDSVIPGYSPSTPSGTEAPEVTTIGQTVKLTWAAPAKATYQYIMRYDDTVEDWYSVGMIFTEGEAFPILQATSSCTFYDYFTETGKTYIYCIEGGYYDPDAKDWVVTSSEDSVQVQGLASDDRIEGSSAVTYDQTTGYLTFDPPLKGPSPHASAGAPKVLLEFDNGTSSAQKLYDAPLSQIDLTVAPFETWFNKTVPIDVSYSPVYEETNSIPNRLHVLSYPNSHYELTGDTEGLTIPTSSSSAPAMPENVSVEAIGDTWVTLTWSHVFAASGYNVYRAASQYGTYDKIAEHLSVREYADTNLNPSTTYWYKIGAYNEKGESQSITPLEVTTSATGVTLPSAPTSFRITEETASSISLAWNSVSGAAGYKIYRDDTSTTGLIAALSASETSYTNTGLSANRGYDYWVSAYNDSGEGPKASVSGQTTTTASGGEETQLTAPTNVKAEAQSNGSIKVTWDAVSGADSYEIRFATSADGNYYYYTSGWTTDTWYIDWDVSSGQTWYYKVRAYNRTGSSPLSSEYGCATAGTNLM